MLTPNELLHISEGAEEIAEALHQDILNRIIDRIMIRLGRGDDYILTAIDKWQIQLLQDAGYLLEDIQQEIAKRTPYLRQEIAEAMEDAGVRAISYDNKIYEAAGLHPSPMEESPALIRIMQRNYEATLGEMTNFTGTLAQAAQQTYIQACDKAYNQVLSGSLSYTQAVREAVAELVNDGVTVTYPSGHTDTIETATLRAVRTGVSQASAQIQTARMDEMGVDLVLVSSHLGARPEHALWQGKVYSRSGSSGKYPDFVSSTGYGTVTGLCGANCRHNFSPYFEGMENPFEQYDSEENQKAYELQQRQRTLERRIRRTKREVMGLNQARNQDGGEVLEVDYQRKAALLQKQNAAYNQFCEENGLKKLPDRISTAKWDRSQAAQARAAARRQAKNAGNASKAVANSGKGTIMEPIENRSEVPDVRYVTRLDKEIYKCVSQDITTNEVIITDERIQHIKERHPNDYERFQSYIPQIIQKPDYILESEMANTAFVLKEIEEADEKFQLIMRLKVSADPDNYKNSVITFLKISDKKWNKYLRNKKILYKKE